MNTDPSALIGSVAPILVLIVLGALLARTSVLDDATVAGLKRIIVNVALPAVLFTTFLKTRFEPEHLWLVLLVFGLCVALLTLGRVLPVGPPSRYRPFLFTGFELGMMGFALFAAGFGADQLPALGVLALGHEVFIWFIFVSLLRATGERKRTPSALLRELATSPTIIAILAGLAANFAGFGGVLSTGVVGGTLTTTLNYLAAVVVPLVLLIVGYGTRLTWRGVRQALPLVATRLPLATALALLLGRFVLSDWWGLDPIYAKALFTLLVLPPPFIVPLFSPAERAADAEYANNVLSLYSVASVAAFVTYLVLAG